MLKLGKFCGDGTRRLRELGSLRRLRRLRSLLSLLSLLSSRSGGSLKRAGGLRGVDASEEFALAFRLVPSTDKSGRLRVLDKIIGEPTDERRFSDAAER